MVDDFELREDALELGEDLRRMVPAAVVDDDNLAVFDESARREPRSQDHARDGPRVVISGKDDGQLLELPPFAGFRGQWRSFFGWRSGWSRSAPRVLSSARADGS
jgi:hypothetical protein